MKSLEDFQDVVARILVALAVVHVCALTGLAALFGRSVVVTFGATALLAAVPVIWQLSGRPGRSTAFALVPALVGQTAILVWLFSEHPWQVEMHFYLFAVLAMLAGFCHVGVLAAAAATIAVHHLILNFVMPSLLYPGGTDVGRVVVHAGFVLVEAGMLALIGNAIRSAFRQAAESELQKSRAVDDLRSAQGALKSALAASGEDVGRLSSRLVDLQTRIGERLDGLLAASETLAGNATKLSGASITVSEKAATTISSASDTSIKVEEVAAVGQNFIRIFAEIATQSAGSTALSEGAVAKVQLTKTTIGQLAVMSTDIDRASKAIETIARQTNLLALNATIEAARAGASGRGFVVVASEVKALAASTAETAADIGKRIVAMQSVVRETVQSIGAIALGIGELDAASMKVSESVAAQEEAVGRIAAVSEAVSRNAERVADAVGAIDLLAQGARTSAGIVETAASDIAVQTAAIRAELTAFATDMAA